ncbi:MAG: hypothetical protein WCJ30_01140 [Deltaproteobacteria bacterium]
MSTLRRILVCVLVAGSSLALASCGSSSVTTLTGDWTNNAPTTVPGATTQRVLHLDADGTGSYRFIASGACSGTIAYVGFSWTVTESSGGTGRALRLTTEPTCSGRISCTTGDGSDCNTVAVVTVGSCQYTLSADASTLGLTACFGAVMGTDTFTRGAR